MSFNLQAQEYSTKSRKAISLFEQARITYSSTEREALLNKAIKKDPPRPSWYRAMPCARRGARASSSRQVAGPRPW